jgi:hypothetical protein
MERRMAWTQPDYGPAPAGEVVSFIPENGFDPITKRVTIAKAAGTYLLPSPHGQPIELRVLNRSKTMIVVAAPLQDNIEGAQQVELMDGEDAVFWLFDTSISTPPRCWWCARNGAKNAV